MNLWEEQNFENLSPEDETFGNVSTCGKKGEEQQLLILTV